MRKEFVSAVLLTSLVCANIKLFAQDEYTAIAEKYSSENAVVTNNTEHLIIQYDDGILKARNEVSEERLLISSTAASIYTSQTIYHSYFNKLKDVQGVAYIPNSKGYKKTDAVKYKTTASEKESVFYDDAKQTEVSYTGLTKGSRTRVDYVLSYKDLHFLPPFYVQNYLPTVKSKLEVTVPKFVHMKFVIKGNNADMLKQTVKETDKEITYTWVAKDVPGIKSYEDAPAYSYYGLHIIPFITDYTEPGEDTVTRILGNTDDLYKFYYKFVKNVNQKDDELIAKTAEEITKGDVTQWQKAKHIYEWVQKNMHYIAFEDKLSGFIPREAASICLNKYGDCKDMTSIQVALYRKVGIDAYFTWIGTRDKPYTYEETPLPMVDNHMICTIKLGNDWIFVDGTDPLIPFGYAPYAIQGKEAMVGINATSYKIIKVPELPADKNAVVDSTTIKLNGRNIAGSTTIRYKGYGAWNMGIVMMYRNDNEKEKAVRSFVSRGSNKFVQTDFSYKQDTNANKDVSISSKFEINDYVQNVDKEYYVNMNLLRSYESEYTEAGRDVPIEHDYKTRSKEVVTMDIPKGYRVTYLPPNSEKKVDGLWGYKIIYTKTATQVHLVKEFELQTLYVMPQQFAAQNKMAEELKKQYKESVVLSAN